MIAAEEIFPDLTPAVCAFTFTKAQLLFHTQKRERKKG